MTGARCNLRHRFAKNFLTLESEQIIHSTREHWLTLLPLFAINAFLVLLAGTFVFTLSVFSASYFFLSVLVALIFLIVITQVTIKEIVEWYFHFYIITNRKIVEVAYRPLFSRSINEVLLDQVRCTEVDVEMRGIFSEVLNIGNVMLTFDRPTHEETFTLKRIRDPRRVAMHLGDSFEARQERRIWYKTKGEEKPSHSFIDEISPNVSYQLGRI